MKNVIKIIAILFIFSACAFISGGESDPIDLDLNVTSSDINTLQDIEADLTVMNISDNEVTYSFSSSCQYGFTILQNQQNIFNSADVIGCLAVITELKMAPQERKTYQISLKGMQEGAPLDAGNYKLKAFLRNERNPSVHATFKVE